MKIKITKILSPFFLTSGKYLQPGKKKSVFEWPAEWTYSAENGNRFLPHLSWFKKKKNTIAHSCLSASTATFLYIQ